MNKTKSMVVQFARLVTRLSVCLGAVAALSLAGCGKQGAETPVSPAVAGAAAAVVAPATPPDPVDLSGFIKTFSGAAPAMKLFGEETVSTIRARQFADASEQLQKMLRNPKLTAEQKQAIQDVATKLQGLRGAR